MKTLTFIVLVLSIFIHTSGFSQKNKEINNLLHDLSEIKEDTTRALIYAEIGYWYLNINPDSSIFYCEKSLLIAQQTKFYRGQSWALANLGNTLRFKGDIPGGMAHLMNGLEIAKENGYNFEAAYCLGRMGAIYLDDLKDYVKALHYFRLAQQYKVDKQNKAYLVNSIPLDLNTGIAFKQLGEWDSSLFYFEKATLQLGPLVTSYKPVIQMYLADLQFDRGEREYALDLLHQSLSAVNQGVADPRVGAEANNFMAKIFKTLNQPDSSIHYAEQALIYAKMIDHKQQILFSSNLLTELYETIDIQKSYGYLKVSKQIENELYGAKKVQDFQKIIIDDLEKKRIIEAERVAYQNRIRLYSLLIGLGVFSVIFFILYNNNRQKQKANTVLEKTLSDLKSTQSQLIQSEKMASLGELTAGIAHEIQNPLNFVNNFSEVSNEMIEEMKSELATGNQQEATEIANDIKQNLEKIVHHGRRADAIVKGMLQHSRSSSGSKEPTDINALCDEYLRLAYHGLRAKDKSFNAKFETDFDSSLEKINVVPQDIGRVVLNLITNAFYAVTEKKKLIGQEAQYDPTVTISTNRVGDHVEVKVADNGNGIPDSVKEKIFQPFFTTKPTGQGTGLGLSLSYDIVKAHGGEIRVNSNPELGSEFIITLIRN